MLNINIRTWIVGLSVLFASLTSCSSLSKNFSKKDKLFYTIEPSGDNSLKVTFEFTGSESGKTYIKHSKTWAGNDFTQDMANFKVLNSGATIKSVEGHEKNIIKLITHKPLENIKVTYIITQNVETPDRTYRAIIKKNYFHLIGHAGLVTPSVEDRNKNFLISLRFKNFPKNYKFANSFFALKSEGTFVTSIDEFTYAFYVGGDYRVNKMIIKGKPLYVSIRGKWKFKDQSLFSLVSNIVSYQRDFFNDHDFDHFFINVLSNERDCCSYGGTGLTNSFASFFPNDADLGSEVKHLLSHELFHTWNGKRIDREEPEELVYWFSEGFTDYYSSLFLLRSGEISLKDLVGDYNDVLYRYYTSNALNHSNQEILKNFWNEYEVQKLPYRRGNILARKWNAEIKKYSKNKHSLDNVLIDFFKEAQTKKTLVSKKSFARISGQYHPGGFKKDIKNFIVEGKTITPGLDDLGPCVTRIKTELARFNHGYDSEKTYQTNIITGLKKNSPAYKAGLRNGQKLIDRNIINPPIKPSWLRVNDKSGKEMVVTFYPVEKKKYPAYLYELNENLFNKNSEKCLQWFN